METRELTKEEALKALEEAKDFLKDDLAGEVIYNDAKDQYVIDHLQFAINGIEQVIRKYKKEIDHERI